MKHSVLFVCLGNICRSPMAEGIFNDLIRIKRVEGYISCDSAGTGNYHIGNSPDFRTIQVCNDHGIQLSHKCRQINLKDFDKYDYIIGMDNENYKNILKLLPLEDDRVSKVYTMGEFSKKYSQLEVPDPYHGNKNEFEKVFIQLQESCEELLNQILSIKEAN